MYPDDSIAVNARTTHPPIVDPRRRLEPLLFDHVIEGRRSDEAAEIRSLGNTLKRWRNEVLAHHATCASNWPTEAMNLLVKKTKRCWHSFKSFRNYRLRVLLHCGGIKWDAHPATTMRRRSPQLVA